MKNKNLLLTTLFSIIFLLSCSKNDDNAIDGSEDNAVMSISKEMLDFGTKTTTLGLDIENKGKSDLEFSIAEIGDWVTFSPNSKTVAPGEITTVIVTINRSEITEPIDQNIVIISNVGSQDFSIIVKKPMDIGVLEVSQELLDFGQTFDQKTFVISNTGTASFDYTLSGSFSWLTVSDPSGTILPGQSKTITIDIDRSKVFGEISEILTVSTDVGEEPITIKVYEPINYGTVATCDRDMEIVVKKVEVFDNKLYIDIRLINNGVGYDQFRFGTFNGAIGNDIISNATDDQSTTYLLQFVYASVRERVMSISLNGEKANGQNSLSQIGQISMAGGGASVDGQIVIEGLDPNATVMKKIVIGTAVYSLYDISLDRDCFILNDVPIIR